MFSKTAVFQEKMRTAEVIVLHKKGDKPFSATIDLSLSARHSQKA